MKTFFVIGSNGVGKTTTMNLLKQNLNNEHFSIFDFDERGVPDNAGKEWRVSETEYWLGEAKKNVKNTIICGFAKPEEIEEISSRLFVRAFVILLDANADTISERIQSRYLNQESIDELFRTTGKSVEKFIEDNIYYSNILRESCAKYDYAIVDVNNKDPQEILSEVTEIIESNLK